MLQLMLRQPLRVATFNSKFKPRFPRFRQVVLPTSATAAVSLPGGRGAVLPPGDAAHLERLAGPVLAGVALRRRRQGDPRHLRGRPRNEDRQVGLL